MKLIASNKRAFHDYEIGKKYEAGISLLGGEVKSIRNNNVSIKGSYVILKNNELFVINMNIAEYTNSSSFSKHDPLRTRKLLLNKREIRKIKEAINEKKMIVVPLKIYWTPKSLIKLEIALAKPLKKYDLREKEKEKTIQKNKW